MREAPSPEQRSPARFTGNRRRRLITAAFVPVIAASAVLAWRTAVGPGTMAPERDGRASPAAGSAQTPGTPARFAILSRQTSNECSLSPAGIMASPPGKHLQGSCCSPMNQAAYRNQVAALRRYSAIPQIPADPYDIDAGLARHLIRYDATLRLSPAQQRIYDSAVRRTPEKGPCCCKCWRWTAFGGLADYLIARKAWHAPQLAALITDLDGCGGPQAQPAPA